MEMVPLKVKIKTQGKNALYPNFNSLSVVADSGMDWSTYIDTYGLGWCYDKTSGHKTHSVESPFGEQWGVLVITEAFVIEAEAMFPGDCTRLTEVELEDFHDNKATIHLDDDVRNPDILISMANELNILSMLDGKNKGGQKIRNRLARLEDRLLKAIDPDDETVPGVAKNKMKKWADKKALMGITIK
jgi:hypothetical protein